MEYIYKIKSPLGVLTLSSDGAGISGLWIEGQRYFGYTLGGDAVECELPVFRDAAVWLDIYFSGKEPGFMPPLTPKGTPFRQSVWESIGRIPYGQTATYASLAPHTSPRAVGGAVGHNPVSILIPCHRVVGAGGKMTGYAAGIDKKILLLRLEGSR
ncbi:MAG: methylated-DNA--[protein]-cysteine S-methyltransferase [Tannerellaceae bacterium]|jgi:methylated-DNA-[protein]-cysteine S-methyltransferase|nr:methylated-DNA--[protein]-cysteine S-methyltransferase [Tannerellaceae bacterium]